MRYVLVIALLALIAASVALSQFGGDGPRPAAVGSGADAAAGSLGGVSLGPK